MARAYACIWSNQSAAEMVKFYKAAFKGAKVGKLSYWPGRPPSRSSRRQSKGI